ncbi:Conserved_hypothetical protein [Hexamita inflata]|uniref:Uncharacterized protein n=1 Tax=Hexamita inflata TaxID=28002 RepID=A0AA86PVM2_9EUKA|nr:Conserved hypothetical protein [Hexamita inflata]
MSGILCGLKEEQQIRQGQQNKILQSFKLNCEPNDQQLIQQTIKNVLYNLNILEYASYVSKLTFSLLMQNEQRQTISIIIFMSQLRLLMQQYNSIYLPIQIHQCITFELEIVRADQYNVCQDNIDLIIFKNFRSQYDLSPYNNVQQLRTLSLNQCYLTSIPEIPLYQLENLCISQNLIKDLSPISKLTQLITLDASYNQIQFLKPISGLVNLLDLYLSNNDIREVISLRSLQKLQQLNLGCNKKLDIWGLQFLNSETIFNISKSNILDESPLIQCRQQYNFHIYNKFVQNKLLQIVYEHKTKDFEYSFKFKRIQFATNNSRSLLFKMFTTKDQQQMHTKIKSFRERTVNTLNKIESSYNVAIEMLVLQEDVTFMQ